MVVVGEFKFNNIAFEMLHSFEQIYIESNGLTLFKQFHCIYTLDRNYHMTQHLSVFEWLP